MRTSLVKKDVHMLQSASVKLRLNRITIVTHHMLGVVFESLRSRVTSEKYSVVLKSASVRSHLIDLTFVERRR